MPDRIDLQPFCALPNSIREYLEHPFRYGDWTYATNGYILVRVPAVEGDAPIAADGVVKMSQGHLENILAAPLCDATFAPLRVNLPPIEMRECMTCGGSGIWKDDPAPGMFTKCDDCDGSGKVEKETSVSIAGVFFSAKYIAQIAALPEAELPTNPIHPRDRWDVTPCPFRFSGGIGALMPMVREAAVHLGDISKFAVT